MEDNGAHPFNMVPGKPAPPGAGAPADDDPAENRRPDTDQSEKPENRRTGKEQSGKAEKRPAATDQPEKPEKNEQPDKDGAEVAPVGLSSLEGMQEISDAGGVDVAELVRETRVFDVLKELDTELVGLAPVKTRIREIASLLIVDMLRRKVGLDSDRPTLHMSFTGSPGTGKTTVAMRMATILHRLGYLAKGHLVAVTRDDLVGQYIGHTAPKTREVLKRAMGGVLFIDEAYYLFRQENERDYGQESIEILLQVMENQRQDIVVVLAGYKDRMEQFFQSNPGMGSRIAHHIDFPDYTLDELMAIAKLMLKEQRYQFAPDAEKAFHELIERRMKRPRFANARSVRNAIERARLRQAGRLVGAEQGFLSKEDLMRIDVEDIRKSSLFSAAAGKKGEDEGDG
jgi:probable Rubsico expression protein CbbX